MAKLEVSYKDDTQEIIECTNPQLEPDNNRVSFEVDGKTKYIYLLDNVKNVRLL